MKYTLLTLIFIILSSSILGQDKAIAKFRITEATINGNDMTDWYFKRKQQIIFYRCEDQSLCMSNFSQTANEQSFGGLQSLGKFQTIAETESSYKTDIFRFRWQYQNTYDNNRGWATISLFKIYKPQGIIFNMKIVLANLDIMEYKGFMEGTIDFSRF